MICFHINIWLRNSVILKAASMPNNDVGLVSIRRRKYKIRK